MSEITVSAMSIGCGQFFRFDKIKNIPFSERALKIAICFVSIHSVNFEIRLTC